MTPQRVSAEHVKEVLGNKKPTASITRKIVWRLLLLIYPATWLAWHITEILQEPFQEDYIPLGTKYDFLRIRAEVYEGETFTLLDGCVVEKGTLVLGVHIDSRGVIGLLKQGVHPYVAIEDGLMGIARYLRTPEGSFYVALQARHRLQHLFARFGMDKIEVRERHGVMAQLEQLYEEMAVLLFHPTPLKQLKHHYAPTADTWVSCGSFLIMMNQHRCDTAPH